VKIAYLTTSLVPSVAANSVQVMKMSQALGRLGHDVTLYCSHGTVDTDPFEFYGVDHVFRLQRAERSGAGKLAPASYLARQMAAILKAGRADLYFSRTARLLYAAAPLGRPLMFEAHSVPLPGPRREALRPLYRLPNFKRLVCISAALARDYLEAYPEIDPAKVLVAHDAANPMDLSEPISDAEWPGRKDAFQVGYVGGIYPGRGVETVVVMARELPHVDFHIIGGDEKTVAFWKEEKGATDNIIFHGHQPHVALRHFYPRLDALLAPFQNKVTVHGGAGDTRRWMSPLKIFEYMATGKPMLCTDFPVLREVLRHDDNAVLLPAEDDAAWTAAVAALAEDPVKCAAIGASAFADFEEHYTWKTRAKLVVAP
jgi:glycosyltransferase involved in cell wall biosynthesis